MGTAARGLVPNYFSMLVLRVLIFVRDCSLEYDNYDELLEGRIVVSIFYYVVKL